MSWQVFDTSGVLRESGDDATQLVTLYLPDGTPVPSTPGNPNPRPYTAEETAREAASSEVIAQGNNKRTVDEALDLAMTTLQAIIDDTNANINTNPASRIKDLARDCRRIIRAIRGNYDGTT